MIIGSNVGEQNNRLLVGKWRENVGKRREGAGRDGTQSKCSNNNGNQWLLVRAEIGRILPDIWPVITVMPLQYCNCWPGELCLLKRRREKIKGKKNNTQLWQGLCGFYQLLAESRNIACCAKLK